MNTIFSIFTIIVLLLMWLFSTSVTINGKHDFNSFKLKSIFYWSAIILSFCYGYIISNL